MFGFVLLFLCAMVIGGEEIESQQICAMSDGAAGGCDTFVTVPGGNGPSIAHEVRPEIGIATVYESPEGEGDMSLPASQIALYP
jgi:hypothetical protein